MELQQIFFFVSILTFPQRGYRFRHGPIFYPQPRSHAYFRAAFRLYRIIAIYFHCAKFNI